MAKTTMTIGMFEQADQAQAVAEALAAQGFNRQSIRIINSAAELDTLRGVTGDDTDFYREFVQRNGTIVAVNAPTDRIKEAAHILRSNQSLDADKLNAEYRSSGANSTLRDYSDNDVVLPVIEESLQVGKRQFESGRMRIYTQVEETPVEEQVTLREEHVNIERRPVDRAVTDADAFQEQAFEVRTSAEQAVVQKEARVVEEVVVNKNVTEHTETVRDTVRRTDVKVEEMASATPNAAATDYDSYSTRFQEYYKTNLKADGNEYTYYDPAFRYGYGLANDASYRDKDWSVVERDARTRWEEHNPNTWEQFKASIRYAWDSVRGKH